MIKYLQRFFEPNLLTLHTLVKKVRLEDFWKRKNTVFPLFYPTVMTNLLLWHLSFSAIQFCYPVIFQNLTHHPVSQIHPAPFWSHERTFTFWLRSPRPYQDTKLLCLSTFANVKRAYEGEKDGRNARRRKVLRLVGHLKRLISCTTVVM